ncbi:arf-GAP domain and FG repeat-containing protein 1-like isoform X1 [Biomphalaria glabrata]|uniref:Arf-GAP domain and FG repeat-containing protein 1-like isoform X1 n=1 Tax=Biomphalaria glabrata TaxID=6526 RepID=A0A9U8E9W0_BIOGL|nr:arf-GAP domain and FG repeat-containing protein 1-like isoform X1 [Biomphalaria glabrata]
MASNKRKQDEKHLKMLREMVSLPSNKQCFDCHQRGPTYVNMTIGSFVCTSCSGILRGLNPPHRVKSISMASFTPEEMDFLKCHGNELNRKVYLGLYDNRTWPEPDSRDEQRVRDYMVQKYENKRWYVAPTEAMREEAKRTNEAALNSKPQVKPLRSLLGENASKLTVSTVQTPPTSHAPVTVSVPLPGAVKPPAAINNQHPQPPTGKPASGFDLLNDLGGDPFAPTGQTTNNHTEGGFADFGNFDSFNSTAAHTTSSAPTHPPLPAFPISNAPLQPIGVGQAAVQPTAASAKTTAPKQGPALGGDRYAALADLDSAFSAPVTTATSINWGGTDGGSLNWGGTDGGAINWGGTNSTASTPSHSSAGLSWSTSAAAAGGGAINWNSQASSGLPVGPTPTTGTFGVPPTGKPGNPFVHSFATVNPFGATGTGMNAFAPVSTVNPFGGVSNSSMPLGNFSQAGGMPISTSSGFGAPFGTQSAGFGAFPPMQNGGFGMTPTSAGYGGSAAFSQQQFMMPSQQPGLAQTSGWGAMGQVPPHQGIPAQPVANPFLNTAMHQVPPPSGSTNPFL